MGFFDKIKEFGGKALKYGKKNASSFAMGGGILLSWTALYLIWQESKKAEEKIRTEEEKLNESNPNEAPEDQKKLGRKEKAIIYAQYCWPGIAAEVAATGLNLYSHKLSADDIAKWYMMSQFLEKKSETQEKHIEKLEAELPDKKVHELENDLVFEDGPDDEELIDYIERTGGADSGGVIFIDNVTGKKFRKDILTVTNGIAKTNEVLRIRREKKLDKLQKKNRGQNLIDKIKDPFFASDKPFNEIVDLEDLEDDDDYYADVYSSVGLDIFWDAIGEDADDDAERRLDEILEFRFYGGEDLLKQNQVLKFKKILDPVTHEPMPGFPEKCYIDYLEFLSPSSELIERNPL